MKEGGKTKKEEVGVRNQGEKKGKKEGREGRRKEGTKDGIKEIGLPKGRLRNHRARRQSE